MARRIARVVILAEDQRSESFVYRYLKLAVRVNHRDVRRYRSPGGSAEQFVRTRYPAEVREHRSRIHKASRNAVLIVHIDADTEPVNRRLESLAQALQESGQSPRSDEEQIVILVPKRHTETWLHGLCGVSVTEEQDCKRELRDHDQRLNEAAASLFELTRPNAGEPPPHLPALRLAVRELRRLKTEND